MCVKATNKCDPELNLNWTAPKSWNLKRIPQHIFQHALPTAGYNSPQLHSSNLIQLIVLTNQRPAGPVGQRTEPPVVQRKPRKLHVLNLVYRYVSLLQAACSGLDETVSPGCKRKQSHSEMFQKSHNQSKMEVEYMIVHVFSSVG